MDDEDYEFLKGFKWCAAKVYRQGYYYAVRGVYSPKDQKTNIVYLHNLLLKKKNKSQKVDHINGDSLDNRRSNLRLCSQSENLCNRGKQKNNSTGFKGVSKHRNKWVASIQTAKKGKYIGIFDTARDAALAYDAEARRVHGEFASLNFR